jgi:tRNA U55 pseudouridine synthase TruB
MMTLDALRERAEQGLAALDEVLLPLDSAVMQWPAVRVRGDAAFYLRQGQPVLAPRAPTRGWVRLYEGEQRFLGHRRDSRRWPGRAAPIVDRQWLMKCSHLLRWLIQNHQD